MEFLSFMLFSLQYSLYNKYETLKILTSQDL